MAGILKGEFGLDMRFTGYQTALNAVKNAVRVYNKLRPHASCDYLTPSEAHTKIGELPKRWKNYYQVQKNENQQKEQ